MKMESKRALIVGASSGMGAACAKTLAAQGYRVALVGRRQTELDAVAGQIKEKSGAAAALTYAFDVLQFTETPKLFDRIVTDLGGLDLVIYAAGNMPKIAKDEYDFAKDRQMIEVNVLGAIAWLNEAAGLFSRVKNGTIVGISSVAGDRGRRGNPVYCASKSALNTYLESLRNRLGQFGVKVLTIKPGFVDTAMTKGMPGLFWLITADEAARQIVEAAHEREGVVYVPCRWSVVMFIIRHIPSFIFKKLDL